MLTPFLFIVVGLGLLTYGADRFILGAAVTARNLGVSPLVIGLTIVGFGTSAPEMLVAGVASWNGNTGLAVGNVMGSNITNIALVVGATALVHPLAVDSRVLKREFPLMIAAMALAYLLIRNDYLSRLDGAVLAVAMVGVLVLLVRMGKRSAVTDRLVDEFEHHPGPALSTGRALAVSGFGLLLLLAGSELLVDGAVTVAKALGVSDLVIGLTVVAVGTSLPELAASVTSALKREPEIAIGNVIGSNMFNILGVLALPGLIHPASLDMGVVDRDFPIMFGLSIVLFLMAYGFRGPGRISRLNGALLLLVFGAYQWFLYTSVR
jgi:cation:H+ antiporter